jgi:Ca2+-transporting ATPase
VIILVVTSANDVQKQKQFQKLEAKKNDREVEVIRAGHHERISVFDLCVGDILSLTSGDILSVDGVFTYGHGILLSHSFDFVFVLVESRLGSGE